MKESVLNLIQEIQKGIENAEQEIQELKTNLRRLLEIIIEQD